jgi:plasmid stability protein
LTAAWQGNPRKGIDVTTEDDVTKVLAVRRAFSAGADRANSGRWSATRQQRLEANARRILRAVLEREPTADEVAAAIGDDDEMSALGRLNEAAAANGSPPAR